MSRLLLWIALVVLVVWLVLLLVGQLFSGWLHLLLVVVVVLVVWHFVRNKGRL